MDLTEIKCPELKRTMGQVFNKAYNNQAGDNRVYINKSPVGSVSIYVDGHRLKEGETVAGYLKTLGRRL